MQRRWASTVAAVLVTAGVVQAQTVPGRVGKTESDGIRLANGWKITPAGAAHEKIGDLPLGAALSPDGKTLAVTNGGASGHGLSLFDAATGKLRQSLPAPRAQSNGLVWSPDGSKLYVAGGNSGKLFVFTRQADGATFAAADPLTVPGLTAAGAQADPAKDAGKDPTRDSFQDAAYLSGLAVSPDGTTLYVANLGADALYAIDAATGSVRTRRKLADGDRPGCLRRSPDGKTLYAALWARGQVLELDPTTLETRRTVAVPGTGKYSLSLPNLKGGGVESRERPASSLSHPNDLLLTRDGSRLFVSCGNADSVYAVDTVSGTASERVSLGLTPNAPVGATPSALALSPDGKTLYVACSDNNSVAVVDVSRPGHSQVRGFIPTAHYPTLVTTSADGKRLFVGSGKGTGTGPNGDTGGKPIDPVAPKGYPYIVLLLKGVLSTVAVPDDKTLAAYTKQVYANTPYTGDALREHPAKAPKPGTNPVPSRVGDKSPIRHVLYIIKENRTYDQVLGDLGKGNGDPNLCLFGEDVTPNHHALAREFVLLDNLYANGEVSVDGHHWTNGAYVPDFMQRTWPSQYGGKGTPPLTPELAATPAGRLWDLCERAKVPFRTYYYHTDRNRSDEWAAARARGERDYRAADIYLNDLAGWEKAGEMPRFVVMALSEDHTRGTTPGAFTPKAAVASNDLAVGRIVEALSRSRFWKETAVFVIEDDAQNGPDHVDAHRTVGLVISPYTRRGGTVDSTFYTTVSMVRTMELILGLPPMSQYDAAATPMYNAFTAKPDLTPFTCRPPKTDLEAKNAATSYGASRSLAFDFSAPDRLTTADEDALNRILWHSVRGASAPYPVPVRRPLFHPAGHPVAAHVEEDEDDD